MNEVAHGEIMVLQSIFFESFKQISDDTVELDFQSQQFNDTFHIVIQFSPDYPSKPITKLELTSIIARPQDIKMISEKLRESEKEMLNEESQPYIFNLINCIDTNEYQINQVVVEEQFIESTAEEDAIVVKENHGLIPGQMINANNYQKWLKQYCNTYKIELIVDENLQPISETDQLLSKETGFKFFTEKKQQN